MTGDVERDAHRFAEAVVASRADRMLAWVLIFVGVGSAIGFVGLYRALGATEDALRATERQLVVASATIDGLESEVDTLRGQVATLTDRVIELGGDPSLVSATPAPSDPPSLAAVGVAEGGGDFPVLVGESGTYEGAVDPGSPGPPPHANGDPPADRGNGNGNGNGNGKERE